MGEHLNGAKKVLYIQLFTENGIHLRDSTNIF